MSLSRFSALVLASGLLLSASGCASLTQVRQLERESRAGRLEFLDTTQKAYFLLGDEYYKLALAAENLGKKDLAREHAAKAHLYLLFSKDIQREAERLRASMQPLAAPASSAPGGAPPPLDAWFDSAAGGQNIAPPPGQEPRS
jgi:hypothetical protein